MRCETAGRYGAEEAWEQFRVSIVVKTIDRSEEEQLSGASAVDTAEIGFPPEITESSRATERVLICGINHIDCVLELNHTDGIERVEQTLLH